MPADTKEPAKESAKAPEAKTPVIDPLMDQLLVCLSDDEGKTLQISAALLPMTLEVNIKDAQGQLLTDNEGKTLVFTDLKRIQKLVMICNRLEGNVLNDLFEPAG